MEDHQDRGRKTPTLKEEVIPHHFRGFFDSPQYLCMYLSSGLLRNLPYLESDFRRSPLTLSILGLKYAEFNVPGYSFIEEKVEFQRKSLNVILLNLVIKCLQAQQRLSMVI